MARGETDEDTDYSGRQSLHCAHAGLSGVARRVARRPAPAHRAGGGVCDPAARRGRVRAQSALKLLRIYRRGRLKPTRAFFKKQNIEAEFNAKVGPPAEVIAKLAESKRFDLLMMGSHGHGSIGTFVLGSMFNKVRPAAAHRCCMR